LIGNSSVGIRESTFLGVPVVNIGSRQNGRERGNNVVDVQYESKEILAAITSQISIGEYESNILYGDGKSGKRISDHISSIEFNIEKKDFLSKKNLS
jgi:UDP-N-acetylglucosamine 2-epimerase